MSGEPRSTLDVDIVVAMTESDIGTVTEALRAEFDVDERAVARAVRERSSVNVFHRASAIKVDLFIVGGSPLDDEQMNRRQRIQVTADPDRYLYAYTPEDILSVASSCSLHLDKHNPIIRPLELFVTGTRHLRVPREFGRNTEGLSEDALMRRTRFCRRR